MPHMGAERRENEPEECYDKASKLCFDPVMSPVAGEYGKQERHGNIHDSVGGSADCASDGEIAIESPVACPVFFKNTVTQIEA